MGWMFSKELVTAWMFSKELVTAWMFSKEKAGPGIRSIQRETLEQAKGIGLL
jgi:hypothetical protein